MTHLALTTGQPELTEALDRMDKDGERIVLEKNGVAVGAVVSIEDLRFLQEVEDRIDLDEARKALDEPGSIPWETLKQALGI